MPVLNARLDEVMPWTEKGRTGMPIKPTGRPCGTLANLAGIAENVGCLTEQERLLRDRPEPLLTFAPTPAHVAREDESRARAAASRPALALRALGWASDIAVTSARLLRRGARGRGN